jgi:hypothetical protein
MSEEVNMSEEVKTAEEKQGTTIPLLADESIEDDTRVEDAVTLASEEVKAVLEDVVIGGMKELVSSETKDAGELIENAVENAVDNVVKEGVELVETAKDEVLAGIREKMSECGIKKSTLAVLVRYTVEAVEDTPMKGADQKDYAIRLIGDLISELPAGEEKEFLEIALSSGSVEGTIELIVSASRGELNVNKVVEVASTSCLSGLLACMAKKQN